MFAIPTGIFGAGFEDMIRLRKQKALEDSEAAGMEDVFEDEGKVAWGDDTPESATSRPNATTGEDDDQPLYSFLDTRTMTGRVYSRVLVAVVMLDVVAFFLSTLDYLEVWYNISSNLVLKFDTSTVYLNSVQVISLRDNL